MIFVVLAMGRRRVAFFSKSILPDEASISIAPCAETDGIIEYALIGQEKSAKAKAVQRKMQRAFM
jgi:hypothetical protein